MAQGNFSQGSEEYVMFADFWQLCKKYWIPEQSDEWWEQVFEEVKCFCRKYGNCVFARRLGTALMDKLEAESIAERRKDEGKNND